MKESDKETGIIEANRLFYEAIESRDIKAMERIWLNSERVKCVHPGWPQLKGWSNVKESWERIFASGELVSIEIKDVFTDVQGDTGWVNCVEKMIHNVDGEYIVTMAQATNIFELVDSNWVVVLHHASPMPVPRSEISSEKVQ